MAVAHLALDLGTRYQRGHRVDDQDVDRSRPDQHVGDLECLLAGVRLAHQQGVGVHAQILGVFGVECVLGVDERRDTAGSLGVGHRMQGDGGLTRGFRAVDLDDAAARQPADAQRHVEGDGAGGDN